MTSSKIIKHYPLSSPQRDIWFDQILHPDVPLYNIGGYVRIDGSINPTLFEKALNQVIQENDALRIILHEGESLPTQTFAENVHIKLDFHDFSEQENAHESALKWMSEEFVKPFQLYDELLFQFALCKATVNCYYWFGKYHHLIIDGWGISLIAQRVAAEYNALATGQAGGQYYCYPDFIQNDQAYLESEKFVKAKRYWQEKYREVPEPLLVPHHAAQFQGQTIPSQRSTLRLKRSFYNQLVDFAKENNISTFHIILGALYCYFVRMCHREDFAIGLPLLNRSTAAFKQTAGLFRGTSPAWFRFGTDLSFVELVEKISKELQRDYRHQRFPIGEITQQVGLHSNQQLFNLKLSYAKHDYDVHFNGNPIQAVFFANGFHPQRYALFVFIEEFHQQDDVNIYFNYNLSFFDADEIERLKVRFEFLLGEILRQPLVPIWALQIMPDTERNKILVDWNDTETDYLRDKTVVDLFEEQVAKTPDAIAVVFEDQQLTYRELNTKANQLAHYLQTLGVKPEVLVGICVERSIEMVIGLLGILKAGGAYLALEPAYPAARLAFMLEDAKVPVLLIQSSLKEGLPETKTQVVCLDVEAKTLSRYSEENLISGVAPLNLAYVSYTSGSTGQPKGVSILHRSVNRLVKNTNYADLTADQTFLQLAPLAFDASTFEIWACLLNGAKLVIMPPHTPSLEDLGLFIKQHQVTILWLTSGLFNLMVEERIEDLILVRQLLAGGDVLSVPHVRKVLRELKDCQLINGYGPTENTTFTCCCPLTESKIGLSVPIGQPIANTQVYILDSHLQLVPIGVPGELHTGGAGLARGYFNRPDLTAEKFINNPFSEEPNSRLYKTGDLARYLPDGDIEYLGRIDNQVKIRGFRIELEAIETVLVQHPAVINAVIIAREDELGGKRLIAYVVCDLDKLELLDDSVQEDNTEIVSQWAHVFEEKYAPSATEQDLTFNLAGWNSSYTGLPIPVEEMQVWVDSTVNSILSLHPNQVLEIGCGTGLLLSRLAPHCRQYWGTDISLVVLLKLEQLKHNADHLEHVVCLNRQADDFTDIEPETFDTVIINSVVQYFPEVTYFLEVLDKAFKVIKPGGHLFIGDLRNFSLLKAYHASVQFYQASDSLPCIELQRLVQEGIAQEQELVIDPTFFMALTQKYPQLTKVQIQLKRGHHHNELTRFRYDVILQVGGTALKTVDVAWQDWRDHPFTLSTLRQHLVENQPDIVGLQQVPNARIETEMKILEWLTNAAPTDTVGQLRKALAEYQPVGIEPSAFWKLSEELPYNVEIS
jgi:amino acid adenylation domain-containing protein